MGIRNTSAFFAGSKLLTFPAGADEVLADCIGLYVETGGYVKFDTYSGETGWTTDEYKVPDGTFIPGMIKTVYANPARGAIATGIHALK